MPDTRLPLYIKSLPSGYAIEFSLTLDEARALAQEVARALTVAWSGDAESREH